ncbi:MAG: sulfatase-like hydrolase/transferase [Planctomycetes bacterium]|nr:sulfatase-like hydrolase/transferase [Planctomycetota bacterium]
MSPRGAPRRPTPPACSGPPGATAPPSAPLPSRGPLCEDAAPRAPPPKQPPASILTSLYPPTHKMDTLWASLSPKAQILPEVFHDGGWRTCLMSANSFLSPTFGFGRGVERFEGTLVNPAMQLLGSAVVNRFRRLAVQEFHTWAAPWNLLRDLNSWSFLGPEGNPYQHGMPAADLRDQFLGWQAGLEGGAPWFAYLQFMEPHAPYDPAPEHRLFDNPEYGSTEGVWFPGSTELTFLPFQRGAEATAEERQAMINNYDACIHEVDAAVGQILDELERRGELENTLVVLTSDHGEEFYEHGGWGHGQSLHAELLGVPLILAGPRVPRGVRVPGQVRSVDIMPTVLQASGLEPPAGCSGEVLDLRAEAAAREAYSEVQWGGHWAVAWRDADGTLIHANFRGEDSRQLYAEADRRETTDLAPGDPAAVRTLSERMGGKRAEYSARALQAIETFVDDSFKDNAAGLGYVDGDPDQDDE